MSQSPISIYDGTIAGLSENSSAFIDGDMYRVVWDDAEYDCVCQNGYLVYGNITDTEFAFVIDSLNGYVETNSTAASHTIAIYSLSVRKKLIDEELLPVVYNGATAVSLVDAICLLSNGTLTTGPIQQTEPIPT